MSGVKFLNILFLVMFILSTVAVAIRSPDAFLPALLEGAGSAVTLSVALVSVYAVWLGFLKVCEHCGLLNGFSKLVKPAMSRLFRVSDETALGLITVNVTANMLGRGGAATPAGVSAMERLDGIGSPAYCKSMLFVVNTASIQLLPTTVIALRAQYNSAAPYDILRPVLVSGAAALILGILAVKLVYGRNKA